MTEAGAGKGLYGRPAGFETLYCNGVTPRQEGVGVAATPCPGPRIQEGLVGRQERMWPVA